MEGIRREEKIIEAGIEYTMRNNPCCIGGDNFYEQVRKLNRNKSFEAGAKWADENPKSPWISVEDDLPCNYPNNIHFGFTNRVLATDGKNIFVAFMKKVKDNKWIWWSEDNIDISHMITHWMPIPEPPKQ